MLEFPGQQHADRHFAPGNCVLGCTKVTLTEDCSMSVFPPLECTQRPLRVKSRPHGITQTHHVRFTSGSGQRADVSICLLCAQKRTNAPEQKEPYSITSSASASSVGGISRPIVPAVCRVNDELELGRS